MNSRLTCASTVVERICLINSMQDAIICINGNRPKQHLEPQARNYSRLDDYMDYSRLDYI